MADEIGGDVTDEQTDLDILDSVDKEVEEKLKDDDDEVVEEKEKEKEEEQEEEQEEVNEEENPGPIFDKLKAVDSEIFKKVPELRSVLGRERNFSEVFSSPSEAKEAADKVEAFSQLTENVLSGDANAFFKELSESSEESYEKFTENILPTIRKAHPEMFVKMVDPVIKQFLSGVLAQAKANGNKDLTYAVGHIAKQVYGDPNIRMDQPKDNAIETERKRLQEEKQKYEQNRLSDFETRAGKDLDNRMSKMLSKAIDPENAYSEKMRSAMMMDAIKEITDIVGKDTAHRTRIQALRKQAQQEGFTGEASERLINAVLARVKPLISSVRQKVVSEYVSAKQVNKNNKEKKFIPGSASTGAQKGKALTQVDYRKMSDIDILDS